MRRLVPRRSHFYYNTLAAASVIRITRALKRRCVPPVDVCDGAVYTVVRVYGTIGCTALTRARRRWRRQGFAGCWTGARAWIDACAFPAIPTGWVRNYPPGRRARCSLRARSPTSLPPYRCHPPPPQHDGSVRVVCRRHLRRSSSCSSSSSSVVVLVVV